MSFSLNNGYQPRSTEDLMRAVMSGINAQFGQSYTYEQFIGTNFYKYFYALIQRLQENEVKTSEIFLKLQDYFAITNERIQRPVVTGPGIVENFVKKGYVASVKPPIADDAGLVFICVDTDETAEDYAAKRLEICETIKDSVVAGCITQGSESETLVLSNGQSFDFKFALPNRIEPLLRLTVTLSENNLFVIDSPEDVKDRLMDNIAERYALGKNFEPMKYFDINDDAPWASAILLEYSLDDGDNWTSAVYDADFDDLFVINLENIELVEN